MKRGLARLFGRSSGDPMNCHEVGELLQHYLDGHIAADRARLIEAHLEDCRRCGLEAETYERIKASLATRRTTVSPESVERLREFCAAARPRRRAVGHSDRSGLVTWRGTGVVEPVRRVSFDGRGVTIATCVPVALVVGTILTFVNEGSVVAGGDASAATWLRVGINYLVPFIVSSIGYLAPSRRRHQPRRSRR